jgi:hypothetical protein
MRGEQQGASKGLIEPEVIDEDHVTRSDLTSIDFDEVICGETSSAGAMGLAGHVWFYVLKDQSFTLYQTWHESDVELYELAWDLVDQNQGKFDFVDGGFGNTIFVKKGIALTPRHPIPKKIDELFDSGDGECFWIYDNLYKIEPSGVGLYWFASGEWQDRAP